MCVGEFATVFEERPVDRRKRRRPNIWDTVCWSVRARGALVDREACGVAPVRAVDEARFARLWVGRDASPRESARVFKCAAFVIRRPGNVQPSVRGPSDAGQLRRRPTPQDLNRPLVAATMTRENAR